MANATGFQINRDKGVQIIRYDSTIQFGWLDPKTGIWYAVVPREPLRRIKSTDIEVYEPQEDQR